MRQAFLTAAVCLLIFPAGAQNLAARAGKFINLLSTEQQTRAIYPFDAEERYHFAFVPRNDRKGISMNELNAAQKEAAIDLLKAGLNEKTVKKVNDIMQLENVLKELEHQAADNHYRDPGKYFLTIFGVPGAHTIWGWRFEGHHIAFNFAASNNVLAGGTPGFLGSNPALVPDGPQKGKEVLKEETDKGFELLHSLSPEELKKAVVSDAAPAEIITLASRRAMIDQPSGIRYSEMSTTNRQLLLGLINVYVHRSTKLFASAMLKDIQQAGLDSLWFTWAGSTEHAPGKPHYYRIQGPTIIIEYDNIQNNANHVHTVVRDLKNDFGGDLLMEHYRTAHKL